MLQADFRKVGALPLHLFFISKMPKMETVFQKEGEYEKGGCFAGRHVTQHPWTGASWSTRI